MAFWLNDSKPGTLTRGRFLQLYDCANAFRTSPEVFTDAINSVCSFDSLQAAVTTPRSALSCKRL